MKNLWTPWRMAHVTDTSNAPDCIFCPSHKPIHDKNQLLLARGLSTLVLLNRFPYANGHLLVAPTKHVSCITDLDDNERNALFTMVNHATEVIKKHFTPHGINIGMNIGEHAGAGICEHIHVHLVPRWSGDHNFMTVVNEVRTIPEHIENTYDHLLPYFSDLK